MRLQVSRTFALTSGQLLVNLFLASWLVTEYIHNQYMQQYMSKLWSANASLFGVTIGLAIAAILGFYLATSRGISWSTSLNRPSMSGMPTSDLKPLDVCPVCNSVLKELSPSRFQCKNCRRYFKK